MKVKATFHAISEDFQICFIFNCTPSWAIQKLIEGHISRSLRSSDPKTSIAPPKPKIYILIVFHPFALDNLHLARCHQVIKRAVRDISNEVQVVSLALFNPDTTTLQAKPAITGTKKFDLWPGLLRHQGPVKTNLQVIHARSYQTPFTDRESVK